MQSDCWVLNSGPLKKLLGNVTYLLLLFFNSFLQSSLCPPPGLPINYFPSHTSPPCTLSPLSSLSIRGCFTTSTITSRPPHSLKSQVSQGLGTSCLIEARPGIPLLYMCGWWWKLILAGVFSLAGDSVSERSPGCGDIGLGQLRLLVFPWAPPPPQLLPAFP